MEYRSEALNAVQAPVSVFVALLLQALDACEMPVAFQIASVGSAVVMWCAREEEVVMRMRSRTELKKDLLGVAFAPGACCCYCCCGGGGGGGCSRACWC